MIIYGILAGRFQPFHSGHNEVYQKMCSIFGANYVYIVTNNNQDDDLSVIDKKKILEHFNISSEAMFVSPSPFRPNDLFNELAKKQECCFVFVSYSEKCLSLLKNNYTELPKRKSEAKPYTGDLKNGIYYIEINPKKHKIDEINVSDGLCIENSEEEKNKYLLNLYDKENAELFNMLYAKFGGKMRTNQRDFNDPKYKAWRLSVLARDKYTCQWSGKKGCKLEVHHIERWADRPDLRYDTTNGITLSKEIHEMITGKEAEFAPKLKELVHQSIKNSKKNVDKFERARTTDNHTEKKRKWIPKSIWLR